MSLGLVYHENVTTVTFFQIEMRSISVWPSLVNLGTVEFSFKDLIARTIKSNEVRNRQTQGDTRRRD